MRQLQRSVRPQLPHSHDSDKSAESEIESHSAEYDDEDHQVPTVRSGCECGCGDRFEREEGDQSSSGGGSPFVPSQTECDFRNSRSSTKSVYLAELKVPTLLAQERFGTRVVTHFQARSLARPGPLRHKANFTTDAPSSQLSYLKGPVDSRKEGDKSDSLSALAHARSRSAALAQ